MQLVIAEKPSVAKSIADVLGALDRQDGYFEGGGYLVSWCVGHLIELAEPESYGEQWKKWTYESLPVNPEHWQYEIKEDTKEQYDVLYGLLHDSRVDEVVILSRLVDTFSSRILYPMLLLSGNHNIAVV